MNSTATGARSNSAALRVRGLPPGPRGFPLLGNAIGLALDPLGFLTRIAREYGDIARFRIPGEQAYLLSHPDVIEEVLIPKPDVFIKDSITRDLSVAVGNGLLTSEGAFWRRQRRLAQPAFHPQRIVSYTDAMVRHAEQTASDFRSGEVRDIHRDMMALTLDIAAETLFGTDVGGAAEKIREALEILMDRFSPSGSLVPPGLPTPGNVRARRALARIDDVVYGVIAERRRNPAERDDLLSMLLRATEGGESPMSDVQLRDEAVTLLIAGHETTALATSYALYLLGQHPDVQDEVRAHIASALGGEPPKVADLGKLDAVDRLVREAMRLYPPAWAIGREATAPCRIGGYDVAPGTQLWIAQWVVHRDPRFFPDPESFRPERWTPDFAKQLHRFAYFPFGGGRRVCIGNSFAMMEAVLVLATILQRVRVLPVTNEPLELVPSVTLRPRGGIRMRVERC